MVRSKLGRLDGVGLHQGHPGSPSDESPLLKQVRLDDIDRSDGLFSMNFEPDLEPLIASAKQVGILEPIWLRRKAKKLQIISGFRRFDVAQKLGMETIRSLVWKKERIDDQTAFQMGIHENILGRGLNLVEKGMVLDKLLIRFSLSRNEVIRNWLPLLNLEPAENILGGFLLINTFSKGVKKYLLSHGLSLTNVMLLAKFSKEERLLICRSLSHLRIGENVLREMLTFLREIAHRDGIRIADLLSNSGIHGPLSDHRLSGPQKIEAIRRFLRGKRYPRLLELEKRFSAHKKGMSLSPQIKITPPPFFEGDRFKIEFSFGSLEEYEKNLATLQKLSKERVGDLLMIKGYGSEPV